MWSENMEQIKDNMQKYANYKEQMGRLKKALTQGFYLEAVFIEYAIVEDRLESVLRHSGKWSFKPGEFVTLERKRNKVANMAEEKKSLAHKYFPAELTDGIEIWKNNRNRIIHALMKQNLHTEDLQALAEEGQELVRTLCGKTTLYNRALSRQAEKKETK